MKIFSVRDKKGQRYIPVLMLLENFVDAERWFSDLVNDGRSIVSKYPADFCLVFLGEFDVESGLCSINCTIGHNYRSLAAGPELAMSLETSFESPLPATKLIAS